jgi:hypothetical protein
MYIFDSFSIFQFGLGLFKVLTSHIGAASGYHILHWYYKGSTYTTHILCWYYEGSTYTIHILHWYYEGSTYTVVWVINQSYIDSSDRFWYPTHIYKVSCVLCMLCLTWGMHKSTWHWPDPNWAESMLILTLSVWEDKLINSNRIWKLFFLNIIYSKTMELGRIYKS